MLANGAPGAVEVLAWCSMYESLQLKKRATFTSSITDTFAAVRQCLGQQWLGHLSSLRNKLKHYNSPKPLQISSFENIAISTDPMKRQT